MGSLVVSGAALVVLPVVWVAASREPRGTNPGSGSIFWLTLVSPFGLAGAGLLLALVVRSPLLPRRRAVGTWFAVACALVAVQLVLAGSSWSVSTDSVGTSCDPMPLLPRLHVLGQVLAIAGAGGSVRLASSRAGPRTRAAALAAGIVGVCVLVLGMSSFAFVLRAVEAACPP